MEEVKEQALIGQKHQNRNKDKESRVADEDSKRLRILAANPKSINLTIEAAVHPAGHNDHPKLALLGDLEPQCNQCSHSLSKEKRIQRFCFSWRKNKQ